MTSDLKAQIEALSEQIAKLAKAMHSEDDEPVAGRFVKFDHEKRLVYAEVYLPDIEDAHGHCMSADEIEKMAHNFMKSGRTSQIDYNHDNNTDYDCYMVESFIARASDPDYYPGSWVAAVKVDNDDLWAKIKNGEITGFSFEGMGYLVEADR